MRIRKIYSAAITAITVAGFVGTTTVAQASPWSWAKRAEHGVVDRVEHAAVGVASMALGVGAIGGAVATASAGLGVGMVSDSILGLVLAGVVAPVAIAALGVAAIGFGGYELYKSHEGMHLISDGYNGVRNAMTKVQVIDLMGEPVPIPAGSSSNMGMHH